MRYIVIILALLFTGCSIKEYKQTKAKVIIIKTKQLKFADVGYIKNSSDAVFLELFVAGRPVKKIEINHLICVDKWCNTKSAFNNSYLNAAYPDDILQHIILGKAIFNSLNKSTNSSGFIQKIKNKDMDITYIVTNKEIYFKDRQNHIIFKIKDTK